ncbi:MAG: urease accessory UreF family protein [Gordonia amarae]
MDASPQAPLAMMLSLADSRLPVGGHVHSGGVEQAVADGDVRSVATLADFLRRRVESAGLVAASVAAQVSAGELSVPRAQREMDARTPSSAARQASYAQGRGMVRLAKRLYPHHDWSEHSPATHLPVISGSVGAVAGLSPLQTALVLVYTTMSGSATAGQRLLALDPADVAITIAELSPLCEQVAREATIGLADLSDPIFDIFAERHTRRDMPLFMS